MKKFPILLALTLALVYSPAMAIELQSNPLELSLMSLRNGGDGAADSYNSDDQPDEDFGFGRDESIYEYDYKSPKRAFIYSLIIPGWGQKYVHSHAFKPLIFLGVEAGLWMGYFKFHNDGNKRTDEFQAFADKYWMEESDTTIHTYRGWLDSLGIADSSFVHTLPPTRDQQYYEMIGKYEQFRAGWDDYWENPAKYDSVEYYISPHRDKYENMRKKANDVLDKANKFIIIAMVNHLISAFDAALSAKRYNRNKAGDMWLSFQAEMRKYSATESIPILRVSCKF